MKSYYLIGSPISHSFSPAMMNLSFKTLGIDASYGLMEADRDAVPEAVRKLKELGASGWNVTMPDKQAMHDLCDELAPASAIGGSVNTVRNVDGKLYGYTTDGIGFQNALQGEGVSLKGKKLALFGTGGAAGAILIQVALDGAQEIAVYCNRPSSRDHVLMIAEKLKTYTDTRIVLRSYTDTEVMRQDLAESTVLCNATNVGMEGGPQPDGCLVPDTSFMRPELFVYDIIYHPETTPLLAMAKEAGCRYENGLSMLIGQGAESFRIWTGETMPVKEVTAHLRELLGLS